MRKRFYIGPKLKRYLITSYRLIYTVDGERGGLTQRLIIPIIIYEQSWDRFKDKAIKIIKDQYHNSVQIKEISLDLREENGSNSLNMFAKHIYLSPE